MNASLKLLALIGNSEIECLGNDESSISSAFVNKYQQEALAMHAKFAHSVGYISELRALYIFPGISSCRHTSNLIIAQSFRSQMMSAPPKRPTTADPRKLKSELVDQARPKSALLPARSTHQEDHLVTNRVERLIKSAANRAYQTISPVANRILQRRIDEKCLQTHMDKISVAKPRINTAPPQKFVISRAKADRLRRGAFVFTRTDSHLRSQ